MDNRINNKSYHCQKRIRGFLTKRTVREETDQTRDRKTIGSKIRMVDLADIRLNSRGYRIKEFK